MISFKVIAGGLLGWSLGSNDAANVFGTAVSSHMVRWKTAAILIAVFVIIGSLAGGQNGLETYGGLSSQNINSAFCISLAAAVTVTMMTFLKIPVSTSQAVVGAIIGVAVAGSKNIEWGGLTKVAACWVGTPIGAGVLAIILYPVCAFIIRRLDLHFLTYDFVMRTLLILAGVYGAYALGANNVANVTGVFYKAGAFGEDPFSAKIFALLIGGASIAIGALTYSKNVMFTVGKSIVKLDSFSAFIAVLCEAITVHIYSIVGVPVSTSQAVVGAVFGIGILKGIKTVSFTALLKIFSGWIMTPIFGIICAYGLMRLFF